MFHHPCDLADAPTASTLATPAMPAAFPRLDDGLDRLCLSDMHAIQVEEISAVEFVREWGRAIAKAALAQASQRLVNKSE